MEKDKEKKQPKKAISKKSANDKNFAKVVKMMANTPAISNKELIERNKKRRK